MHDAALGPLDVVDLFNILPASSLTDPREDGTQQDLPSGIFPLSFKAQNSLEIHSTEFQCRFELRIKFYILYKINILR